MTVSLEERCKAKTTRIGSDRLCPIQCVGSAWEIEAHCHEKCEWNDGDGCAIWRIVQALQKIETHLGLVKFACKTMIEGGDSK